MLTRIGLATAATVAGALALLGLLTAPLAALSAGAVIAVCAGPLVAICLHIGGRDSEHALRAGAATTIAVIVTGLIVAGLIALFGAAAALVVPLLAAAVAAWEWRRRPDPGRPAAAPTPPPARCARHGGTPTPPAGRAAPRLPDINCGVVPTAVLCAAWQRTYWLLHDLPPASPDRAKVVDIRARLLDEFERRDPAGFTRWLDTEPRACSDPGRYLSVDH